jgi:ribonuclease HII
MKRSEAEEWERLNRMCVYERPFWDTGRLVAGIDEAGRGPLAGPCVAAAVVMPPDCLILGVDDSKKVPEKRRESLYGEITQKALSYAVCIVDSRVIDEINILNAAKRAFAAALNLLSVKPDYVFCDRIGGIDVPLDYEELVGGDAKVYSIAAASIIAKVTRDRLMRGYECAYPGYGFAQHKGYGTKAHAESIRAQGPCAIHRRSFLSGFNV